MQMDRRGAIRLSSAQLGSARLGRDSAARATGQLFMVGGERDTYSARRSYFAHVRRLLGRLKPLAGGQKRGPAELIRSNPSQSSLIEDSIRQSAAPAARARSQSSARA